VRVVAAGPLTAGGAGRCDSALLTLDDGSTLVVRAPADPDVERELAAEALALRALTPGVRGLLGVRAPELLGEAGLGDARALVTDFLPGYQVDAAHIPGGPGAATSLGQALASVHALPASVVRAEGLPVRSPEDIRDETATLMGRADATDRVPRGLLARWHRAVASDELWRFESTVILGGAGPTSFLFEDTSAGPTVTGVLDWHGLSVGDPATDLRWIASAPEAADDIFAAYQDAAHRAPDGLVRSRARLYAELEFAKWLVHGSEQRRADIMDDAVALLESLAASVRGDDLVATAHGEPLDDAMAILDRVPASPTTEVDTSMQTDAYDAEELAQYVEDELADAGAPAAVPVASFDDTSTAPIDLVAWADARTTAEPDDGDSADPEADAAEADRAAREALRRWAASE
jgi:aminoglycoside phosphotransferase (APT) family kinase protein